MSATLTAPTPLTDRLIQEHFQIRDSELVIGGVSVSELCKKYGSPCFIYDRHVLDKNWKLLRTALPSRFDISYSVKANPHPAFLKYYVSKGCGLEVASGFELQLALKAGCEARRIVFAGPGKSETELELALSKGIDELHIESLTEAERVLAICQKAGCQKSCFYKGQSLW